MEKLFLKSAVVGVLIILLLLACKNKQSNFNRDLSSLNLLRGELLLCNSDQFGEVNFSLSCSYETRETFDLAMSLLHSFEYVEAEKAFVKVIYMDPDCAMAYWGVSMSIFHSLWMQSDLSYLEKGKKLLQMAGELPMSEREKDYLDAIGVYYNNWNTVDKKTRKLLYEEKMKALYSKHRDDTEAAVFYALAIRATADPNDKMFIKQKQAGKILDSLFVLNPNHPGIAHYIIHNYDYAELASLGLNTARKYAQIAPASAHAQHMPSHIFTRLGLWNESISTNLNSISSAQCYAENVNPEAKWSQEIHAMDYLVYAYLQIGDTKNVNIQNEDMQSVENIFPSNHFAVAYTANAIPARVALETKQWELAANLQLPTLHFDWEDFPWEQSILHFAKAMGSARSGDVIAAEKELTIIQSYYEKILNSEDALKVYKAGQIQIEIKTVEAWIQLLKGNSDAAISFMQEAADLERKTSKHPVTPGEVLPADELLGDLLLELNRPLEALKAYEVNLKGHPNRFNGLYGAAIAAKESGNKEKARKYFGDLLKLTENVNSDRKELIEARIFVSQT